MLHNCLIDILIMMLNIIASYNKLLYAIINTLYKFTKTSRINFAKTHDFEIQIFQSTKDSVCACVFVCVCGGITILSRSAENFRGELDFCLTGPNNLWDIHHVCPIF